MPSGLAGMIRRPEAQGVNLKLINANEAIVAIQSGRIGFGIPSLFAQQALELENEVRGHPSATDRQFIQWGLAGLAYVPPSLLQKDSWKEIRVEIDGTNNKIYVPLDLASWNMSHAVEEIKGYSGWLAFGDAELMKSGDKYASVNSMGFSAHSDDETEMVTRDFAPGIYKLRRETPRVIVLEPYHRQD